MIYDHYCPKCNKTEEYFRSMSECSKKENCRNCGTLTERIYTPYHKDKEFQTYYDEKYKCEITGRRQEEKLMKRHGDIYTCDTPAAQNFREQKKSKQKNKLYFT